MADQSPVRASAVVLYAGLWDSENVSPHMLVVFVHTLHYVLEKYGAAIMDEDGTRIIGAFNIPVQVPLPAYVAMKCAMEMQQVFNGLRREMGGGTMRLTIGINRGVVSLQEVTGDAVRTAEFVAEQSITDEPAETIVSGVVYEEIKSLADQFKLVGQEEKPFPPKVDPISLYHFTLPDNTEPVSRNLKSIVENKQPNSDNSRVLIAEDAPALRSLFAKVLKNAGFDVNIAVNGHDVLAQIEAQLPDVLVIDLGMPGISGEEVIRRVQQRSDEKRVKIVVVTGNHLAGQSALADAVDLILIKPVSPRDLVDFVKRFI
jgi:CheY-like chemotaxis protein